MAKRMKTDQDRIVSHWMYFSTFYSLCWFAADFFARVLHNALLSCTYLCVC